jgi:hypothetical protein
MIRAALVLAAIVVICVLIVGCAGEGGLPPGFNEPPPGTKKPPGHPIGDCTVCHGPGAAGAAQRAKAASGARG